MSRRYNSSRQDPSRRRSDYPEDRYTRERFGRNTDRSFHYEPPEIRLQPRQPVICFTCNQPGHISPNCPLKLSASPSNNNSTEDKVKVFSTNNPGILEKFIEDREENKKNEARAKELQVIVEAVQSANQAFLGQVGSSITSRPTPVILHEELESPPRKKARVEHSQEPSPKTMIRSLSSRVDRMQENRERGVPVPLDVTPKLDQLSKSLLKEFRDGIQSALSTPSPHQVQQLRSYDTPSPQLSTPSPRQSNNPDFMSQSDSIRGTQSVEQMLNNEVHQARLAQQRQRELREELRQLEQQMRQEHELSLREALMIQQARIRRQDEARKLNEQHEQQRMIYTQRYPMKLRTELNTLKRIEEDGTDTCSQTPVRTKNVNNDGNQRTLHSILRNGNSDLRLPVNHNHRVNFSPEPAAIHHMQEQSLDKATLWAPANSRVMHQPLGTAYRLETMSEYGDEKQHGRFEARWNDNVQINSRLGNFETHNKHGQMEPPMGNWEQRDGNDRNMLAGNISERHHTHNMSDVQTMFQVEMGRNSDNGVHRRNSSFSISTPTRRPSNESSVEPIDRSSAVHTQETDCIDERTDDIVDVSGGESPTPPTTRDDSFRLRQHRQNEDSTPHGGPHLHQGRESNNNDAADTEMPAQQPLEQRVRRQRFGLSRPVTAEDDGIGVGLQNAASSHVQFPRNIRPPRALLARHRHGDGGLMQMSSSHDDESSQVDQEGTTLAPTLEEAADNAANLARARVIYAASLKDQTASRKKWNKEIIQSECAKHGVRFVGKHLGTTVTRLTMAAIK